MKHGITLIAFTLILSSCNHSSKGSWSDDDLKRAKEDLQNVSSSLDILGNKKQVFIDCYLHKIEEDYASYDELKNDEGGGDNQAAECMQEVFLGDMK